MMIEKFKLAKYQVVFQSGDEGLVLPAYKGSTLRGGFGNAFQRIACAQPKKNCKQCLLKTTCPYSYIFETAPPPGSEALSNYEAIPRPFIIEPPLETKTEYKPGELLIFNLILIGKATEYLPYFIVSFRELANSGFGKGRKKCSLQEIRAVHPLNGEIAKVYGEPDYMIKPVTMDITGEHILRQKNNDCKKVKLNFLTMTRLKFTNEFVKTIEFHILIRNLLRRLSSLAYFHHGWEFKAEFRRLIEKAKAIELSEDNTHWVDWERYSSRQDSKINLGGVVGEVTYQGDLEEFMPLLVLGQFTHVGKAAVFGMGGYRLKIG